MTPVNQLVSPPTSANPNLIHGGRKVTIGLLKGNQCIQSLLDQNLGFRTTVQPFWETVQSLILTELLMCSETKMRGDEMTECCTEL